MKIIALLLLATLLPGGRAAAQTAILGCHVYSANERAGDHRAERLLRDHPNAAVRDCTSSTGTEERLLYPVGRTGRVCRFDEARVVFDHPRPTAGASYRIEPVWVSRMMVAGPAGCGGWRDHRYVPVVGASAEEFATATDFWAKTRHAPQFRIVGVYRDDRARSVLRLELADAAGNAMRARVSIDRGRVRLIELGKIQY